VRALLSVALYELEDERTPEYAVVDAAYRPRKATDASRASGLINAVLRRYLRERKGLDAEIASRPAARHAAPIWLRIGFAPIGRCAGHSCWRPATATRQCGLRVNSRLASTADYLAQLQAAGSVRAREDRVPYAIVLDSPCDVQELPGFAQGLCSVQDLGAQCVAFPLALARTCGARRCAARAARPR